MFHPYDLSIVQLDDLAQVSVERLVCLYGDGCEVAVRKRGVEFGATTLEGDCTSPANSENAARTSYRKGKRQRAPPEDQRACSG